MKVSPYEAFAFHLLGNEFCNFFSSLRKWKLHENRDKKKKKYNEPFRGFQHVTRNLNILLKYVINDSKNY